MQVTKILRRAPKMFRDREQSPLKFRGTGNCHNYFAWEALQAVFGEGFALEVALNGGDRQILRGRRGIV